MTKIIKLAFEWNRPSTVPFPKVWRQFEAKSPSGEVQKFIIQDLTPDRYEEAWVFCSKTFWSEEPVAKTLKMTEDANLMMDIKNIFLRVMQQNMSLIGILDDPNDKQQIVALSVMAAHTRNDEIVTRLCGPKAEKFEMLMDALREDVNVFDRFDVDVVLEDYGTSVASEFRGQQLARNIIFSANELARECGIGAKTVTLSNRNLSSVAKQDNLETFREIIYDDFRGADGNLIIPIKDFKCISYCGVKF